MELPEVRFFNIPEQSFFLFGARGTGKSTWLRHDLTAEWFLDLLDPAVYRELQARPERLRDRGGGCGAGPDHCRRRGAARARRCWTVVHELMESPDRRASC